MSFGFIRYTSNLISIFCVVDVPPWTHQTPCSYNSIMTWKYWRARGYSTLVFDRITNDYFQTYMSVIVGRLQFHTLSIHKTWRQSSSRLSLELTRDGVTVQKKYISYLSPEDYAVSAVRLTKTCKNISRTKGWKALPTSTTFFNNGI